MHGADGALQLTLDSLAQTQQHGVSNATSR